MFITNKKVIVWVLVTLVVLVLPVLSCQPNYNLNENVTILDVIHEHDNNDTTCTLELYNATAWLQNVTGSYVDGNLFSYDLGNLSRGEYLGGIECFTSPPPTFVFGHQCHFEVGEEGDDMSLAAIILLPLLFGFLLLKASSNFDDQEHWVFRVFLNLLSVTLFFVSLNMALIVVVEYYGFSALQVIIGNTVLWYGWLFGFMIAYFFVYSLWKFRFIRKQKKANRLET